jgi:protein SCO1
MSRGALRSLAGVSLAGIVALASGCGPSGYVGQPMQPSLVASDIPLRGAPGTEVSFARTGGRLTLTAFGYTSCPDVCPTTLSAWREVRKGLGADTAHVRFVFVSGDWRHDTPEHTAEFAAYFDRAFIGVTADSATIRRILPQFQAEVGYGSSSGSKQVGFAHTDYNYVVDETGRIAFWYPFRSRAPDIVADLRRLLRDRKLVKP